MTTGLSKRVLARIDRRPAAAVFLILLFVYAGTASWGLPYHIDAYTNVLTAWKLGSAGSFVLDEYADVTGPGYFNVSNQLVPTERGPISKYPPGAALLAAPLYVFAQDTQPTLVEFYRPSPTGRQLSQYEVPLPRGWPGTLVALLATAAAMATLTRVFAGLVGNRSAWTAGLTLGLGTSFWSVASDFLWQHGPATLWIAAGLLAISKDRFILSSSCFALAIMTRPQTAILIAVLGLWMAWSRRSPGLLLRMGIPAAIGLAAYIAYNQAMFGSSVPTAAGGYWVDAATSSSWTGTAWQLAQSLLSPNRGVLFWSPVLLVALLAVRPGWRVSPDWAKAAGVAAIFFLVFQVRGNGSVGGEGFQWYRYQLEAVASAAPLLALSIKKAWNRGVHWQRFTVVGAGVSIAVHAYAAYLL